MLHFGVTIRATVPQGSEIPEGLMNNPVYSTLALPTFYTDAKMGQLENAINAG